MNTSLQLGAAAKAAMFAIAGAVAVTATASAQVTFTAGDVIVGFSASGGTGQETNVLFNLGSGVSFRDGTFTSGAVADLGAVLSATYGSNWFQRTDLSWGMVAARNANSPSLNAVVNGDTNSTVYLSVAADTPGASTPPSNNGNNYFATNVQSAASNIVSFWANSFSNKTAAAGTGNLGVIADATAPNSFTSYVSPINGYDFTIVQGGVTGSFGTGDDLAYLDLYRLLARTTGATNENGVAIGQADYLTTFSIDANGIISAGVSAVPEPSAFAALAGAVVLGAVATRRRRNA